MPKSTFIGLVFLIAALLVASVPELLHPTAGAVEQGMVSVGLMQPVKQQKPATKDAKDTDKGTDDLSEKRLALRGYVVEKDGDLRDSVDPFDRDAAGRGRLAGGSSRLLLSGQRDRGDLPPATSENGILLDITGCPLFRPETDVALLLADPDTAARYAEKAADSDDPAGCATLLDERIAAATAPETAPPLGATTQRDRDAIRRGGTTAMIIALAELELLADFMDDESLQESLAALEGEGDAKAGAAPADAN